MKAKEYLSRAYRMDLEINTRMQQIDRLRSMTQRMTTFYGYGRQAQPTGNVNAREDAIIRLIEAENEMNAAIDRLVEMKQEIGSVIDQVEEDLWRVVLTKRYLCFMSWDEISEDLHYSQRWVLTMHRRGLVEAEEEILEKIPEKIPEKEKDSSSVHISSP